MKHGDYRYTLEQYVDWLERWTPTWAAMMDWCCENEITSGRVGVVRERQKRTTDMAWRTWTTYTSAPWAWVPTVQGWTVDDYTYHAREMRPLVEAMKGVYGQSSPFRVGIGTLCRRASVALIRSVIDAVQQELPATPLHLWGIKLGLLKDRQELPESVVSVDSAAWNGMFGTHLKTWKGSGMVKNKYAYTVALPAYRKKIDAALNEPKQRSLF
jgi:hypothetical protein